MIQRLRILRGNSTDHRHRYTEHLGLSVAGLFNMERGVQRPLDQNDRRDKAHSDGDSRLPIKIQYQGDEHRQGEQQGIVAEHGRQHQYNDHSGDIAALFQPFALGKPRVRGIGRREQSGDRERHILPRIHRHDSCGGTEQDEGERQ